MTLLQSGCGLVGGSADDSAVRMESASSRRFVLKGGKVHRCAQKGDGWCGQVWATMMRRAGLWCDYHSLSPSSFFTASAVPACLLDADQFRDDLLTRYRKGGMQRAQRGQEQLPVGSVLLETSRQRGRKLQCWLG